MTSAFSAAFALVLLLGAGKPCPADDTVTTEEVSTDRSSDFALGFDIDSYDNNFGVGLTFVSPRFFRNTSAIQFTGDIAWVEGVRIGALSQTTVPYGAFNSDTLPDIFSRIFRFVFTAEAAWCFSLLRQACPL